jgi:dolichyl-phosphate-mannose-protein mannosyltransferase
MALGVTASAEDSDRGGRHALLLLGIIVVALLLRFWRLGDWGFEATEIFTHRDSIVEPSLRNPRPLMYFLNYYVVRPLVPLDEFGLRLLPAIFGVLVVPALYFVTRRLVGARAGLFSAFLVAISSIQVYYSQYARYWTLVFLLCSIYPFAIYLGIRERNRRMLALGLITGVLAVLAHPVSVILFGGLGLWIVATYLRRDRVSELWQQRGVRWGAAFAALLVVIMVARFIPMLRSWIAMHDTGKPGEFLLHLPAGTGVKQASYILAYTESLTLPLVLTGCVGIYMLWQTRDRSLALLLACVSMFHLGFMLLVSFRTSVALPYFLMPSAPAFFIGGGVFLDQLSRASWNVRPRWLLPATVTALIITAGVPTLISQYRDGRRWDFRGVARWLNGNLLAPEDVVYSDQPQVLAHYLPGTQVHPLRADTARLVKSVRLLRGEGYKGALWVILPAPSHAFRTNAKLGVLNRWIFDHCQERNSIGVTRVDFRQHFLQIYRCPPPGETVLIR